MPESLQQKVAFLSQPSSYLEQAGLVEAIETHMSWVFLTDLFAYKLKKPVVYNQLDFSTLEARRHYCAEEVRLNRRLTGNVYLNMLPLVADEKGALHLSDDGRVVEWLIKMRRLPSKLALDQCIRNHSIPEKSFLRLTEKLSRFYHGCRPENISPNEYLQRYARNIIDLIADLADEVYDMPVDVVQLLFRKLNGFMRERENILLERVRAGKIIEGHGDLRAEHIYLEVEPAIVDCLEFSKDLRTVDAASDIAFLALDCERLGAKQEGKKLMKRYCEITGDSPPQSLIHFYQAYHAGSRARLSLWHLKEAQYQGMPKWRQKALEWLQLAHRHAKEL